MRNTFLINANKTFGLERIPVLSDFYFQWKLILYFASFFVELRHCMLFIQILDLLSIVDCVCEHESVQLTGQCSSYEVSSTSRIDKCETIFRLNSSLTPFLIWHKCWHRPQQKHFSYGDIHTLSTIYFFFWYNSLSFIVLWFIRCNKRLSSGQDWRVVFLNGDLKIRVMMKVFISMNIYSIYSLKVIILCWIKLFSNSFWRFQTTTNWIRKK